MGSQTAYSRYSFPIPGLDRPLRLQGAEVPRISRQLAREGGNVVSPTRQLPLCLISLRGSDQPRKKKKKIPMTPSGFETTTFQLVSQYLSQQHHCVPLLLSELILVLTCIFLKHLYVLKTPVLISTAFVHISNVLATICKSCMVRISKAYAYLKQLHVSLKRVSKTSDPRQMQVSPCCRFNVQLTDRTEYFLSSDP
jgi:hypothetical protein